jgi:hypothetical protein
MRAQRKWAKPWASPIEALLTAFLSLVPAVFSMVLIGIASQASGWAVPIALIASWAVFAAGATLVSLLRRSLRTVVWSPEGIRAEYVLGSKFVPWSSIETWGDSGMNRQEIVVKAHRRGAMRLDATFFEDPSKAYWQIREVLEHNGAEALQPVHSRYGRRFDSSLQTDLVFAALILSAAAMVAANLRVDDAQLAVLSVSMGMCAAVGALGLDRSHQWHSIRDGKLIQRGLLSWRSMKLDSEVKATVTAAPANMVILRRGRQRIVLSPKMPGFGAFVEEVFDHLTARQVTGDPGLLQEIPPPESPLEQQA